MPTFEFPVPGKVIKRESAQDWRDPYLERKRREFKETHQSLLRYGAELPPVDDGVRIITVVPAYKELVNDNFWRLVRSFNIAAKDGDAELLYVVNNMDRDAQNETSAYQENQRTLRYLHALRSAIFVAEAEGVETALQSVNAELTELKTSAWELSVFARAVEVKSKIYGIDASSDGWAFADQYNSRGQARNIGGHIAYERLLHTRYGINGMIDFIDADCFLSPKYYEQLLKGGCDEKFFTKSLVTFSPDISQYVEDEKEPIRKLAALIQYLKYSLLEGRVHYLLNVNNEGDPLEQIGHGPSMAMRADLFRETGGYPNTNQGEDFVYWQLISRIIKPSEKKTTSAQLNVSHRSRDEASDGFRLAALELDEDADLIEYLEFLNHPKKLLRSEDEAANPQRIHIPRRIQILLQVLLNENEKLQRIRQYQELRSEEFRKESRIRRAFLSNVKKTIAVILQNQNIHGGTVQNEQLVKGLPKRQADFLLTNPSLLDAITTAYVLADHGANDTHRVLSFFEQYLPEYFLFPPANEPDYLHMSHTLHTSGDLGNHNFRDVIHLAKAVHDYKLMHQQQVDSKKD